MDYPRATAMDPGVILGQMVNLGEAQDDLRWLTFPDVYSITDPWSDRHDSLLEPDWSQRTLEDETLAISRYRRQLPPSFMRATGEFDFEGDWLRNVREFEIFRSRHIPNSVIDGELAIAITTAIQVERTTPIIRDARWRIDLLLWKRQARVEALGRESIRRWMVRWLTAPEHIAADHWMLDVLSSFIVRQVEYLSELRADELTATDEAQRQQLLHRFRPHRQFSSLRTTPWAPWPDFTLPIVETRSPSPEEPFPFHDEQ